MPLNRSSNTKRVLCLLGTRPEVIKFAPVLRQLAGAKRRIATIVVASGQHTDLLHPLARLFDLQIHHDLPAIAKGQAPASICRQIVQRLLPVLDQEHPGLVLVQGDTSTALAGSIAAAQRRIPLGHIEAWACAQEIWLLPFPEEFNRRTISSLATSTTLQPPAGTGTHLFREGVADSNIFLTGNPGIDSLLEILHHSRPTLHLEQLLGKTAQQKRIIFTAHRRENFGEPLAAYAKALRKWIDRNPDVSVIFPRHPNPEVSAATRALEKHPRIHITPAMGVMEISST